MIPAGAHPLMFGGAPDTCEAYQIARSVRFNSPDTAYLTRTPGASGNRKTVFYSGWVKRGQLVDTALYSAGSLDNFTAILMGHFADPYKLVIYQENAAAQVMRVVTSRLFRDGAAHCHIAVLIDTTQATPANRVRVWINGVEEASFSTASYPALNLDTYFNHTVAHYVGHYAASASHFGEYQLSEVRATDGVIPAVSDVGFVCPSTEQWRPKEYAGTYGATGWYLDFSDNSAATSGALGKDRSGNNNDWTPTNISVTAGAGNDSLTDTTSHNYCVWDVLYPGDSTKTNGALDAAGTARGTFDAALLASYWEITANAASVVGGVVSAGGTANTVSVPSGNTYGFRLSGGVLEYTSDGSAWNNIASGLTGQQFPYASGASNTANFGQRAFAWTQPSGYATLHSRNLPSGTVTVSGTFTGNASADGPRVDMNGCPETLTINSNAVTFGTHADRLANGFKLRTSSASYNTAGSNTWTATVLATQSQSLFKYQNAKGNP